MARRTNGGRVPDGSGGRGSGPRPRVVIITQPKSGTYLTSEIVRRLGFHQTYMHLRADSFDAYDGERLEEGRRAAKREFEVKCPIEESVKIVRSGQFAAGHLACDERTVTAFAPFRIVHLRRELRASLVSCFKFCVETGRHRVAEGGRADLAEWMRTWGRHVVQEAAGTAGWMGRPGVLSLRFEDLRARPGEAVNMIARHLGVDGVDGEALYAEACATRTLTRSGSKVSFDEVWTDEVEAAFRELGGDSVNRKLGYVDASEVADAGVIGSAQGNEST